MARREGEKVNNKEELRTDEHLIVIILRSSSWFQGEEE